MAANGDVLDDIRSLIGPALEAAGVELYDMTLKKVNGAGLLMVLVDKNSGISLDECAKINRRVSGIIEHARFFSGPCVIEVSSPGLDRPLKIRRDFSWALGCSVDVWPICDIKGKNFISGIVKDAREDGVEIEAKNGECFVLPYGIINKAKRNF
ncbi:MAG: hypothetical protein WC300_02055 [Candidatus Omnitrophota bacterium]|jgi:ribosome maturation factor RimP